MSDDDRLSEIKARLDSVGTPRGRGFLATSPGELDLYQLGTVDVRWLIGQIEALRAELGEVRALLECEPDEGTLDAVRFMHTEWKHYSREMNRAGYETIPRLTAERDEARAECDRLRARVADREHALIRARAERDALLAALVSIEWQPRRTLAGTEALFCPACGRPREEPEHLRALNRKHGGIRDDGHRRDCPLALALAETRGGPMAEHACELADAMRGLHSVIGVVIAGLEHTPVAELGEVRYAIQMLTDACGERPEQGGDR